MFQVTDAAALQLRLGVAALGQRQLDVQLGVFDQLDSLVREAVVQLPRRRRHTGRRVLVLLHTHQDIFRLKDELAVLAIGLLVRLDQRDLRGERGHVRVAGYVASHNVAVHVAHLKEENVNFISP